jgi:hypothetical protein
MLSPTILKKAGQSRMKDSEKYPLISSQLFNNGYLLGWLSFDNLLIQPKNSLLKSIDNMLCLFTSYFEHFSIYRPSDFIELSTQELKPTLIHFPKK